METVKKKRKKLTKLIEKGHGYYYSEEYKGSNTYEAIAEYLIQNGVTTQECGMDCKNCWKTKLVNPVQEWVSVDERLPEDGSSVFVMLTHTYESDYVTYGIARYIDTSNGERHWYEDHHGYLEWDKYSDGRGGCSLYKVTHWMPIPAVPQPPKGVQ